MKPNFIELTTAIDGNALLLNINYVISACEHYVEGKFKFTNIRTTTGYSDVREPLSKIKEMITTVLSA